MKFFGEYLIEKEIINEQMLVDALVEQAKLTPSITEIVHRLKLLSPSELLKVIAHQSKNQTGFVEACKELNLWTDALRAHVAQEVSSTRTPIGQILINRGSASFDKITHALDEYLSEIEKAPEVPANAPSELAKPTPAPAGATATRAISPEQIQDYCEIVNDSVRTTLTQFFASLKSGEPIVAETIKSICDLLHRAAGTARFIQASSSEKIFSDLEAVLRTIDKQGADKLPSKAKQDLADIGTDFLEIIWGFRQKLIESGSEQDYLSAEDKKKHFDNFSSKNTVFQFDLSML